MWANLLLPLFLLSGGAQGLPKPQRCVDDLIIGVLGDPPTDQQSGQIPIEPSPSTYQEGHQAQGHQDVIQQAEGQQVVVQQVQSQNIGDVAIEETILEVHDLGFDTAKGVTIEEIVENQTEKEQNAEHSVKEGIHTEEHGLKEGHHKDEHHVKESHQTDEHNIQKDHPKDEHHVKEGHHTDEHRVNESHHTNEHKVKDGQDTSTHHVKLGQDADQEFQTSYVEAGSEQFLMKQHEEECVCVPYYLCHNGSVNTDGTGVIDIKIKPRPCEDYMDVCCEKPVENKQPIKPPSIKRQGCGFRHPSGVGFKVTGASDNEAEFGEFPWMSAILKISATEGEDVLDYQCGGSLIHNSIVLTAAHCVKTHDPKTLVVRLGEWDTRRQSEVYPHRDVKVVESAIHPDYSSGSLWNDFALLFLKEALPLGENIDTVCLPPPGEVPLHHECFASGWGKNKFGEEGEPQVILKKMDLPIVENHQCESMLQETRLGKFFKLHKSFVCAGGVPGKDTCKGDGGGPLVCPIADRPGMYEVTGIVAWGIGCGGDTPGIYANVAYARDWIDYELAKFDIHLE